VALPQELPRDHSITFPHLASNTRIKDFHVLQSIFSPECSSWHLSDVGQALRAPPSLTQHPPGVTPVTRSRFHVSRSPLAPTCAPWTLAIYAWDRHMHISLLHRFHTTRHLPWDPAGPSECTNHLNTAEYLHNRRAGSCWQGLNQPCKVSWRDH